MKMANPTVATVKAGVDRKLIAAGCSDKAGNAELHMQRTSKSEYKVILSSIVRQGKAPTEQGLSTPSGWLPRTLNRP